MYLCACRLHVHVFMFPLCLIRDAGVLRGKEGDEGFESLRLEQKYTHTQAPVEEGSQSGNGRRSRFPSSSHASCGIHTRDTKDKRNPPTKQTHACRIGGSHRKS